MRPPPRSHPWADRALAQIRVIRANKTIRFVRFIQNLLGVMMPVYDLVVVDRAVI
jgi:hypothetical protein